nr:MAG TPA: hypothetical protein [Caudoviricetes sp.]
MDDKMNTVKEFHKRMRSMKYGFIVNNKIVNSGYDKYRTIPLPLIEKFNVGICWDFVNYQQDFFNRNGISSTAYFFIAKNEVNDGKMVTHTFNVLSIDGKTYWFEAAFKKHSGIYEIKSYNDVIKVLLEEYGDKYDEYIVSIYNTKGMDLNLTSEQFINKACNQVVKRGRCK